MFNDHITNESIKEKGFVVKVIAISTNGIHIPTYICIYKPIHAYMQFHFISIYTYMYECVYIYMHTYRKRNGTREKNISP